MCAIVIEERVLIPDGISDLESFRRWARSDDFPQRGRFSFLNGEMWIDMSPEELLTHNMVKGEYDSVLNGLVKKLRLGLFFHDRTLITHVVAGLSTEPDGCFVSYRTLRSGRIRLVEGTEGYVEMEGTPDMALEVVSASSVKKDTVVMRELYWKAGVKEYWLVDARGDTIRFDILRRGRSGYVATRKQDGWLPSAVFGKSFKLTCRSDEMGYPEYTLSVR